MKLSIDVDICSKNAQNQGALRISPEQLGGFFERELLMPFEKNNQSVLIHPRVRRDNFIILVF
jgi:hypothetical protein